MTDPFAVLDADARDALTTEKMPERLGAMLATLTHERFSDPEWVFERKLDGVRCLVYRSDDEVRLLSRNDKRMNESWPELVDALAEQSGSFVADGEIVAFDGDVTSFSRLQGRIGLTDPDEARASGIAVKLYLFDILHLDGRSTRELPLRERKKLLRSALHWDDPIRYTPPRNEHGERYLKEACAKGWEGIIGKRASSTYVQKRSRDWLKLKCSAAQELVVVGFTDPQGSREGFGALRLGYYEDDDLIYAGKVGTGFDDETLVELRERMDEIERDECPLDAEPKVAGAHWVEPKLVAEVGFTEWTRDHRLRHPRFLGLRFDNDAEDVVREDR